MIEVIILLLLNYVYFLCVFNLILNYYIISSPILVARSSFACGFVALSCHLPDMYLTYPNQVNQLQR